MAATTGEHWGILITNQTDHQKLVRELLHPGKKPENFRKLEGKKGGLFSRTALARFIEEEVRHDNKLLTSHTEQTLQSFSSGERKKALLAYLMNTEPDFLVLDNPFDHLDRESRAEFEDLFHELSGRIPMVQFSSRMGDLLPFINTFGFFRDDKLQWADSAQKLKEYVPASIPDLPGRIPPPQEWVSYTEDFLIRIRNLSVNYREKKVLKNINWDIRPGEFWELAGKNGSGKTTILSIVTGDNPKGYGQDIHLFGRKKGSGESIWDIKQKIGYFTPAMIDRFRGYHSLENMLISGLLDSIGLYVIPSEGQKRLANSWLRLVGMDHLKDRYFHELSPGQQRLVMCIRAMIKHPLLIILDEPTAGLDDASAALIVSLVNKMAEESQTTTIFVSHRREPGLKAPLRYQLNPQPDGSRGEVIRMADSR